MAGRGELLDLALIAVAAVDELHRRLEEEGEVWAAQAASRVQLMLDDLRRELSAER